MKRKFTFLAAALALFAFLAVPLGMRGQTRAEELAYTLDGTEVVGTNSAPYNSYAAASPVTQDGISWEVYANTNMTPWRIGGKNLTNVDRPVYSTTSMDDNITKIEVTHGTASNITVNSWTVIVASDADFNNVVSTLTPTFAANATTTINRPEGADWTGCYFKFVYNVSVSGNSNRFVQFTKAEFYKQEGSGPVIATPTFSPAAGTYTEAQSVSISCETQGTTIYYTTDGSDPDDESTEYTGSITVSETTTIKAIAIDGDDNTSSIATATYNILTPMTIAEVRAQGTGSVFTSGTVTSCVGTTGYIQDATAAICVYGTALTVGDNITVQGTLSDYNGLLEITNPVVTVVSSGNTVNPELMTIAQVNASTNQGWYVRIEGATVTAINDKNATIAQGENSVVVRFANASDITFAVDDIISLNGNIGYYNANQIANPQNVTVQENENPTISAENVNIAANAIEGEIAYTINNPVSGGVLTAATTAEWLTLDDDFTSPIAFDCSANTTSTARTATVTLTYTYNTNQTVTKDVTVTQAGYETPHFTWDLTIASYASASEDQVTWTSDYATMVVDKANAGTNANNYLGGNQTSTRFYKNSVLTITPVTGYAITSVVFEATTTGYASALQGSTWTNATASVDGTTVTVTPTNGTIAMSAVIGGTCGFTGVTVYYVEDNTPTITANDVTITYNTDGDEIEYIINNPVSGGSLVASTESDWLEVGDEVYTSETDIIEFTCSVNPTAAARTATVTLTYTYNRATVTKNVTVTQEANPNVIDNISDITEAGTYTVRGTIVAKSTRGFVVGDGTGYVYYYNQNYTQSDYNIGDIVKLSGSVVAYGGVFEFNASTTITAATGSNYVAEDPTAITGAQMDARVGSTDAQLSSYVQYQGVLSVNDEHYNITNIEGATTAQGSISYPTNTDFTSLNGKTVLVKGYYVGVSSSTYYNTMLGTIEEVEVPHEEYTLTVEPFENLEIITFVNDEMVLEADGEIQVNDGDHIMLSIVADEGYVMETLMVNGVNHVNDIEEDFTYTFIMPAEAVTISATAVEYVAPTPGNWVLTSLADLTEDDVFVIVGTYEDPEHDSYAMSNDKGTSAAPEAVSVTIVDNTLSEEPGANIQWNISGNATDGYVFYPNGDNTKWLYITASNAKCFVGTNANDKFVLDSETGYLRNVATQKYIGIYNASDWRGYNPLHSNIAGQTFAFYKKVESPVTETYTLEITGYSNFPNPDGGYYLIASPVTVNPADVEGMTEGSFDLYYFDEAEDNNEWQNWKDNDETGHFNLVPGKGYLYAHQEGGQFELTGTPYDGDGTITLNKTNGTSWSGWNLVGNPFGETAYIQGGDWDFYVMNQDGLDLEPAEVTSIGRMQGIFVVANSDGEQLTFTTEAPTDPQGGKIVVNVRSSRGNNIDRAMIRFGEGRQLPKFQLNPDNTKLYIAQEGEDFAVVRSIDENSTPVSFRAAENGIYTLSVNADNIEMEYLHLIDNMTGNDIDLLATPSYTFEARTTDYADRFNLVYATCDDVNENNMQPFAFFNGSEWVINNAGNALLQVVDVTGRVISSETLNGNAHISLDQVPGVYVMRLVSGNNVKVQKVIIK